MDGMKKMYIYMLLSFAVTTTIDSCGKENNSTNSNDAKDQNLDTLIVTDVCSQSNAFNQPMTYLHCTDKQGKIYTVKNKGAGRGGVPWLAGITKSGDTITVGTSSMRLYMINNLTRKHIFEKYCSKRK